MIIPVERFDLVSVCCVSSSIFEFDVEHLSVGADKGGGEGGRRLLLASDRFSRV